MARHFSSFPLVRIGLSWDLLYKPVVLACGHTSCFWCVHKAMHGYGASYCPICRLPYYHFPSFCPLLHYLPLILEPEACKRREMEVFGEHLKQLNFKKKKE